MAFLEQSDFNTHLYPELISAIDRDNEGLLDKAVSWAEGEVKGYIARYNITSLFAASGANRNDTLLGLVKDIALWQFVALANPDMSIEFIGKRYDDAMRKLREIQSGKLVPFNWPLVDTTNETSEFLTVSSATRRPTSY